MNKLFAAFVVTVSLVVAGAPAHAGLFDIVKVKTPASSALERHNAAEKAKKQKAEEKREGFGLCRGYMSKVPAHLAEAYCKEQFSDKSKKPVAKSADSYSNYLSCMSMMTQGSKKVAQHLAHAYCKQLHYRT